MSSKLLLTLLCCALASTGCNLVYKQNVQQGNAIEQEKLDQLKLGMTMTQVAFLMGTPAVRDPFHQNRWDYVYTFSYRGGKMSSRRVMLRFENAILKEMTGIQESGESPDADTVAGAQPESTTPGAGESTADDAEAPVTTPIDAPQVSEAAIDAQDAIDTQDSAAGQVQVKTEPAPEPVIPAEAPAEFVAPLPEGIALAETNPTSFLIQLGAYDSLINARNLVDRLRGGGFEVDVYMQELAGLGPRFLVRSAGFETRVDAERQLQQINSAFELDGFLIFPSAD